MYMCIVHIYCDNEENCFSQRKKYTFKQKRTSCLAAAQCGVCAISISFPPTPLQKKKNENKIWEIKTTITEKKVVKKFLNRPRGDDIGVFNTQTHLEKRIQLFRKMKENFNGRVNGQHKAIFTVP